MTLKSFGCSFVFGTELADHDRELPFSVPSQYTWPALLADHLQIPYQCHAIPGSGNLQILENVLNQASVGKSTDLFVISWTWIDRFDYYDTDQNPHPKKAFWSTVMPSDQDQVATTYFKKLHSEYKDKLCSLIYIKLAIDTLQQKNIPFLMTYMDDLLFDQAYHISPAVRDLQDSVRPHMTDFDGLTFLQWSHKHDFQISKNMHPLDQAHKEAAKLLFTVFDKQKTNDPVQQARV